MTCRWLCPRCTEIRTTERPPGCPDTHCPTPVEVEFTADPAPAIRYVGGIRRFLGDIAVLVFLIVGAIAAGGVLVTAVELGTGGSSSLLQMWPAR